MLDPKIRIQVIRSHALVVHGERMAAVQQAMLDALPMDPLEMAAEINKMSVDELAEYERLRNSLPQAQMFDDFNHVSSRLQALSVGLHIDDRGQLAMARGFLLDACTALDAGYLDEARMCVDEAIRWIRHALNRSRISEHRWRTWRNHPEVPDELPVIAGRLEGNLKLLARVSA